MTLDYKEISATLPHIQPDQKIVYHEGFLAKDCMINKMLREIRQEAWNLYDNKRAILTSKRIGVNDSGIGIFRYEARGIK